MAKQTDHGLLGETMDRIAYTKVRVRGPYNVADYIREKLDEGPSGPSMSDYYNDKTHIPPRIMRQFVKAFECTPQEQQELAWVRTFRCSVAA